MTFVTCKHRAEAQGESRLTTEDLFEVREGLRFDSRGLRTLSSSKWMKSEGPTSLETDLDVESDSVVVPRAPTAPRRCAPQRLQSWLAHASNPFIFAASRSSPLRKSRVWTRAATRAGGVEGHAISGTCRAICEGLTLEPRRAPPTKWIRVFY